MTKKPIDKDAIIVDLQEKIATLERKLKWSEKETQSAEERAKDNYTNGRAWKDVVDSEINARKDSLSKERASVELRIAAEKRLSFAEGYIAALKGESYDKPIPEEKVWG